MSKQEIEAVIATLASAPPVEDPSIADQRAGMEQMTGAFPPPEGAQTKADTIGGVPCEWQWMDGTDAGPVLLYFHGGGYALGSVNTHRGLVTALSAASGMRGLSVDYRLAPEHPFPAAVDDAVAVYRALIEDGTKPADIAVAGDSAGGGLSLALLVALKEHDLPQPACAALLSPWSDLRISAGSYETRRDADPWITREGITQMAKLYLGDAPATTALASPLLADLSGLAPLLIHVGDREVLLDDAVDLAERARAAGVDAQIAIWDDMIHVFQAFFPLVEEGRQSIAQLGKFIAEQTA